jgi:hypothetical protein
MERLSVNDSFSGTNLSELVPASDEVGPITSQYSVWLQTGRPGFDPWQRQRIFPLASASKLALGPTQPPVQRVLRVLSPGVKHGRGCDADHSPPSSADVKYE